MELDSLFGLPAHPLIVHEAVVLVPIAVLSFVLTGWRAVWRKQFGLIIASAAVLGWLFAFLASQTGEPLQEHVRKVAAAAGQPRPRFGEHPELGNTAAFLSFVSAVAMVGFYASERWLPTRFRSRWLTPSLYAGAALLGLVTLLWIVRAGHSGAQLAWGK